MALVATVPPQTPQQMLQIESFWNLINDSDEAVQLGVYSLLEKKYAHAHAGAGASTRPRPSFRQMKGILQPIADTNDLRDEYLNSKYGL